MIDSKMLKERVRELKQVIEDDPDFFTDLQDTGLVPVMNAFNVVGMMFICECMSGINNKLEAILMLLRHKEKIYYQTKGNDGEGI